MNEEDSEVILFCSPPTRTEYPAFPTILFCLPPTNTLLPLVSFVSGEIKFVLPPPRNEFVEPLIILSLPPTSVEFSA